MDNRINSGAGKCIAPIVTGVVTSIAFSIFLLIVFSVFMLLQNMPRNSGFFLSYIIICLSAICGGFVSGRTVRSNGLVFGAVTGFLFILIISLIGFVAGYHVSYYSSFIVKALFATLCGGAGGILAINIRKK